ncbi:rhomboid family intramembrane serine protease [Lysobacter pythonis]|uniref:Rhomboid family intramembrane serine protease n=2 Tax=Solilutibacter pythonis TaxID=2483112 RepID=A0A3M2HQ50_9GAMM|nr:rhomboid family intramembrane serine protease [Lysobacter pythonis]
MQMLPAPTRQAWLLAWGALGGPLRLGLDAGSALAWLRLISSLFLHADWAHLVGNLVFLMIFGLPAERLMGSSRFLLLFLLGGAVANLAAAVSLAEGRVIIGASGTVSAVLGAWLALFPRARLGVVVPLGLFLEFVRAPAALLIGLWALLQVVFAYIGPAYGQVAWVAHLAGFGFGGVFALLSRRAIAKRMRKQAGY